MRREVALYRFLASERQAVREKAEAEEQARRDEEEKLRSEAEAEKARAEAAARDAEAARRRAAETPVLNIPPAQDLFQPELTPLESPTIQTLPGVEQ